MLILTPGYSAIFPLAALDSLTLETSGTVKVEAVSGLGVSAGVIATASRSTTLGPYSAAGSMKITAIGAECRYGVVPATVQPYYGTAPASASIVTATSAAAIPANSLGYFTAAGLVALADALTSGKKAAVFIKTAAASGATTACYLPGQIIDGLTGLTPGAEYAMSVTPGQFVLSSVAAAYPAGRVLLPIGVALSATTLLFSVGSPINL